MSSTIEVYIQISPSKNYSVFVNGLDLKLMKTTKYKLYEINGDFILQKYQKYPTTKNKK